MNPTNPYDTIQQLRQRVAELENECENWKQQRDGLLAALAIAEPVMDAHAGPSRLADFHATIASVKEKS